MVDEAYRFCRMCKEVLFKLPHGWACGICDRGANERPHWMSLGEEEPHDHPGGSGC